MVLMKPLDNSLNKLAILITAVASCIVSNRPGGTVTASQYCRKKAAILIFGDDFKLLLVARDIAEVERLARRDR
jgi:hypothetical protein